MVINGIFECFYSFSHQWLVRSYKEDCALLDSFIEKYKKERYQKQRIAIVTGSNTGIGKEIVEALFRAGWYVIMASRSKERAETAIADIIKRHHHDSYNGDIKFIQLDISRYDSICQFVKEFESSHKSLDLLINNAGIYEQLFVPIEGLESQFVTNHLGPFVLTEMLEKFMKPHTRVIQVGSVAQYSVHKIDRRDIDHPILFFPRGGYSLSKALLALSSITLSEKYSKKPVYVFTVHPGGVSTEIYRSSAILNILTKYVLYPLKFLMHPRQGALSILWIALYLSDEEIRTQYNGQYISDMKIRPMPFIHPNNENSKELRKYIDQASEITRVAIDDYSWMTKSSK